MGKRRIVFGLGLTGLIVACGALPAHALLGVPAPPVPEPGRVQTLVQGLVPATPTVTAPEVDPGNPQLPYPPFLAVPPSLQPAFGALSPTTVVTCQAAYLGPLGAIVAVTAAFDAAGVDPPVRPTFFNPVFSVVTAACAVAPFPTVKSCGPDATVTQQLAGLPPVPAAGPLPSVDPFATVPAPFASLVVALGAVDQAVGYYAYGNTWQPKTAEKVANQLSCE